MEMFQTKLDLVTAKCEKLKREMAMTNREVDMLEKEVKMIKENRKMREKEVKMIEENMKMRERKKEMLEAENKRKKDNDGKENAARKKPKPKHDGGTKTLTAEQLSFQQNDDQTKEKESDLQDLPVREEYTSLEEQLESNTPMEKTTTDGKTKNQLNEEETKEKDNGPHDLSVDNEELPKDPKKKDTVAPSITSRKNKLLILDVDGILGDVFVMCKKKCNHGLLNYHQCFLLRPYCDDFLESCFYKFDVAIWTSRNRCNLDRVLERMLPKYRDRFLFHWDQEYCDIGCDQTHDNKNKPLYLKNLQKVWQKYKDYGPKNTILVDDSPAKAMFNPVNTAVFPESYTRFKTDDNELGPKGGLWSYLDQLSSADDVQQYISENKFGQKPMNEQHEHWWFYEKATDNWTHDKHRKLGYY